MLVIGYIVAGIGLLIIVGTFYVLDSDTVGADIRHWIDQKGWRITTSIFAILAGCACFIIGGLLINESFHQMVLHHP